MILNPYRDGVRVVPGCRVLNENLKLIGRSLQDPLDPSRHWVVENLYAPLKRQLGGIRVKVRDQKEFVSFINQRDLEVVLGQAVPGDYCRWLGEEYVSHTSADWFGFCADEEDLKDDLYDRELALRMEHKVFLPTGIEILRRVHLTAGIDVEELWVLIADCHPEKGFVPDASFSNVHRRWVRAQQERVIWKRI